jgi:alpha-mannosidase
MYAEVFKTAEKLFKDISKVLGVAQAQTTTIDAGVALNTLPWHRKEVIAISETEAAVACGHGSLLTLRTLQLSEEPLVSLKQVSKGVFVLENSQLRVKVEAGAITSLYDRLADREIIPKGRKANQYVMFDDKPLYWQAWDVEVYHLETRKELHSSETKTHEEKTHRVSVVTHTKISDKSSIKTVISLAASIRGQQSYVEVTSEVEWHETMKFLKVEFPVDVRNTEASYETQFGVVRRPTHYNTSWDMAKFEVCSHRFADLSEHNYGVSVLNDSKYGFATAGNTMRLSLLRSPKAPDAHADMGTHRIRWAILPHTGALSHVTVRKAFEFNNPLKLMRAASNSSNNIAVVDPFLLSRRPPVYLTEDSSPALILDTVKRGEDDEDVSRGELPAKRGRSVILRIYDSLGGRARGHVATTWDVARVCKVNLLEDELEEVELEEVVLVEGGEEGGEGGMNISGSGSRFAVDLRPFEVATFKLQLASA